MKTIFFILFAAFALNACAKDEKTAKPTATDAAIATTTADNKQPVQRLHHRMQLAPVTADKFMLARKN